MKPSRQISPATNQYLEWKQTGDPEKRDELIHRLDGVINTGLKNFGGGDNTLKTRAYLLASDAVKSYNPARDTKLETHVYNNLKRLTRYRNERNAVIHVPENVRTDSTKVFGFIDTFRNEHGREPTLQEISDVTGLPYKRINKARQTGSEKNLSQFETEKGDTLVGKKRPYADIWKDYIYHDMDPVNQKIFEWLTGYQGNPILSKREIAERLDMSPSSVTQRTNRMVKMIQKGMTGI